MSVFGQKLGSWTASSLVEVPRLAFKRHTAVDVVNMSMHCLFGASALCHIKCVTGTVNGLVWQYSYYFR